MTHAHDLKIVLDALDKVDLVVSDLTEPKRTRSEAQMLEILAAIDNNDVAAARKRLAEDASA